MSESEKMYLKSILDKSYRILKDIPDSRIKGSEMYELTYLLEKINLNFNIPFND